MFHVPAHKQTNPAALPGQVREPRNEREAQAALANETITSIDYAGRECILVNEAGAPFPKNGQINDFRGELDTIIGGRAPHHAGSTGSVYTEDGGSFYPHVYGLRWIAR